MIGARVVAASTAFVLLCVAGCGGDPPAEFGASGAWSRPTPAEAGNGVVYLTVTTDTADALVDAEVPGDIARGAELHVTLGGAAGGAHQHGGGEGGEVSMAQVDGLRKNLNLTDEQVEAIEMAAGETLVFAPGGNHIMLVGVTRPLVLGERFSLTLHFTSGRALAVPVVVADNPPQ